MKTHALLAFTLLGLLVSAHASKPPLILQNGEAKAERAFAYSGLVRRGLNHDGSSTPFHMVFGGPTVIMDDSRLKSLWKQWKLGKVPAVDFQTQVVIVNTWTGSRLDMMRNVDDKGNLMVFGAGGTKDLVPGFTYVIEAYTLTGIKAVNGQEWPKPKKKEMK